MKSEPDTWNGLVRSPLMFLFFFLVLASYIVVVLNGLVQTVSVVLIICVVALSCKYGKMPIPDLSFLKKFL